MVIGSPALAGLITPLRRLTWQQIVEFDDAFSVVETVATGTVIASVGLDAVVALPNGLRAVTWTRSRWLTSALTTL